MEIVFFQKFTICHCHCLLEKADYDLILTNLVREYSMNHVQANF